MKKCVVLCVIVATASLNAAESTTVVLWPEGVPETTMADVGPEKEINRDDGIVRLTNVTKPMVTFYKAEKPNGTAVIVCPGGGYSILAYEHEGTQVCEFLTRHGVTALLLKYRVPAKPKEPLQDAQRALGLVRKRAADWGLDADRIGILGFSAGGHLAMMAALKGNERTYPLDRSIEADDPTPSFVVPIYPAYLTAQGTTLLPEITVTPKAPPMCLIHSHDDPLTAAGSALVYLEYKKLGLPCELHIFAHGGHGFGMKMNGQPVNRWPDRVVEWMGAMGYLRESGGSGASIKAP